MPPLLALLVTATIVVLMFSLGLGLKQYPFVLLKDRPAFLWRVMLGTCIIIPLVGLLLVLLPLHTQLSRSAWTAMALMLVCPSAPLILFRVHGSGGTAELAARLQIAAALLAIGSIPLMALTYKTSAGLLGWDIDGWVIHPAKVAVQVLQVQVLPVIAGMVLGQWNPRLADRCSRVLRSLSTLLLLVLIVVLLVFSGRQLGPFLQDNLLALGGMALLTLMSLGLGYFFAGKEPVERRTVGLVMGMRNTGLALQLAVTYGMDMPDLIPTSHEKGP